jgi:HK97 family phage portal protein
VKPSTQSKILDEFGKPIENKAIDARAFFGVDHVPTWPHGKSPDKRKLLEEFKGLVYACVDLIANTACTVDLGLYFRSTRKSRFPSKQLSGVEATKVLRNPYRKVKLRTGQTLQELEEHPALQLLQRPNSNNDTQETIFWKTYQLLKLTGEAYWYTPTGPLGTPVAIHVLNSALVKPVIGDNNEVVGYEYGEGGKKETYSAAEIVPFIVPDPANPHRGKSPLAAVYDALEIDEKLAATLSSILENNGRPDGILSVKDGIGEDEALRLEHRFNAKFRRNGNGGIMVVGEEEAKLDTLTFSPRDMSWLPINEQTRLKICNVYHVPYALLDKAAASQYDVQATLRLQLVEDSVVPMLRLVQSALNAFFVPKFDDSGNLWLQFEDATPTNKEQTRADVQAGIVTPNEAREDQGREPLPGADQLAGMYSLGVDTLDSTTEPAPEAPESDENPAPTTETTVETAASEGNLQASALNGAQLQSMLAVTSLVTSGQMSREAARITLEMAFPLMDSAKIAALVAALEVAAPVSPVLAPIPQQTAPKAHSCGCDNCKTAILGPDGEPTEAENQAPTVEKTARKTLKSGRKPPKGEELAKVLKSFFAKQRADVLGSLKKSHEAAVAKGIKADLPDKFVDLEDWDRELYKDSQPLIELYFRGEYEDAAKDLVARVGISDEVFNVTNPFLRDKIKKLALRFCEETNRTTSLEINAAIKQLRESLEEGLTTGERMSQLQSRVEEIFDSAEESRSWRIAQTEASRSHNLGAKEAARDSGVVSGYRLMLSSEACELCQSLANKDVGFDDVFYKDDGAPAEYQDKETPPIHPNCLCTLEMLLIEPPTNREEE